jgi:valyl-tRNA synthetase
MHLDSGYEDLNLRNLSLPDQWIFSRLDRVTKEVADALDDYRFNEAAGTLYNFVWHEFCDWYLEAIKPALYDKEGHQAKETTRAALWRVLRDTLVLLHPFIPFVTEEIWHHIPGTNGSIMKAEYPVQRTDAAETALLRNSESKMAALMDIITGVRNVRGEMNISPTQILQVLIQSEDENTRDILDAHQDLIINLARLGSLEIQNAGQRPKSSATAVVNNASIFVLLEGVIDIAKESKRLEKEIKKLTAELATVSNKLSNEGFLSKAPADVVEKVKEKQGVLLEKQQKIQTNLDRIKEMGS